MKKTVAIFLSMILLSSMIFSMPVTAAESEAQTAEKGGDYALSEYENNEVFVMYKDGSFEVISYESADELAGGLEEIANDENVTLYQPNFSYEVTSFSTNDEFVKEQWALSNDGSFYMEEEKNDFPVFDKPFENAKQPGEWEAPDDFGKPGGNYKPHSYNADASSVKAVEGIDINLEEAWKTYSDSGKKVVVALVDTGIDYTHEDLSGNLWTNDGEIPGNGIDDDGNGYVDDVYGWNFYDNSNKVYAGSEDDHGTHGAGTIVASANNNVGIAGIAQNDNIEVMCVKALGGKDGSGSTSSVIRAIQYAEANGASICNLSLGTSENDKALYQTIANSNMLFVVAAGNDSQDIDAKPSYPASYNLENLISVGNLNYDGTLHYSSNYGKNSVDIAAPGSYILSTTTNNGYSYMTGTSMSAPFVSAAAAMVYSHYGDITLAQTKEILLSSATKLDSLSASVAAGGMLNLGAALNFDRSNLTGAAWEEKTPYVYNGTAPQITAKITNLGGKSYLTVQFYDEDNDISAAAYAKGELKAEDFGGGKYGNPIKLTSSGTATYVASAGTYTFYAIDSKGNETTKVIKIVANQSNRNNKNVWNGFMPGWFSSKIPTQMPVIIPGMQMNFNFFW